MTTTSVLSKQDVLNAIGAMSVRDIVALTEMMEKEFGVSAAQPIAMAAAPGPEAAVPQEEQTEFTVLLTGFAEKQKIAVIKLYRELTGASLGEAKKAVESSANGAVEIKAAISKQEADKLKEQLEASGAIVKIK